MRSADWGARRRKAARRNDRKSYLEIVLQSLAPSIITGLLAGAMGFLLASKSEIATKNKTYLDLKLKHADETSKAFADYVSTWRRLMIQCQSVVEAEDELKRNSSSKTEGRDADGQRKILSEIKAAMIKTANSRPERRDRLMEQLEILRLYFSQDLVNDVDTFNTWDEGQQAKKCSEMPPREAFKQYEAKIVGRLRKEITP